jgi:hypothetical protein
VHLMVFSSIYSIWSLVDSYNSVADSLFIADRIGISGLLVANESFSNKATLEATLHRTGWKD